MSDHIWHRGLWFAIKYINGINFWEERPDEAYGAQAQSGLIAGDQEIIQTLIWRSNVAKNPFKEVRKLRYGHSPGCGAYIDWTSELQALQDLELDRTPFTTWGGYSGLSFRGSRELHQCHFFTDATTETLQSLAGQRGVWCAMETRLDGGSDEWACLAILDHPSNVRHPVPWYCKSNDGFTFMNAALLFHEPLCLRSGERIKLQYRVLWHDGKYDRDRIKEAYQAFVANSDEN